MPKPRNAVPGRDVHIVLAEEDASRLELHLWSEAEQRIPFAARQRFFTERLREFFGRGSIDLGLYLRDVQVGSYVYGPAPTIERLREELEALSVQS